MDYCVITTTPFSSTGCTGSYVNSSYSNKISSEHSFEKKLVQCNQGFYIMTGQPVYRIQDRCNFSFSIKVSRKLNHSYQNYQSSTQQWRQYFTQPMNACNIPVIQKYNIYCAKVRFFKQLYAKFDFKIFGVVSKLYCDGVINSDTTKLAGPGWPVQSNVKFDSRV